jgi:hypothetical protein
MRKEAKIKRKRREKQRKGEREKPKNKKTKKQRQAKRGEARLLSGLISKARGCRRRGGYGEKRALNAKTTSKNLGNYCIFLKSRARHDDTRPQKEPRKHPPRRAQKGPKTALPGWSQNDRNSLFPPTRKTTTKESSTKDGKQGR